MPAIRPVVAASWQRSTAAGVQPAEAQAPLVLARAALDDYRTAHPLWRAMPVLHEVLEQAVLDCDALLAVADEHGQLLFVSGSSAARDRAERIGFAEGSSWDERIVGTNAPGTALALGEPVMVRQDEHFREAVHQWSCVAVPIRDPLSGGVIGAVDLTGGDHIIVPQTMAMLRAAARLAEMELMRSGVPAQRSAARVSALGVDSAALVIGDRTISLSPRHSEIVAMLVAHPRGLTGDEIACGLYESESGQSTVRAELLRLRSVLGDDVLASRPYRLTVDLAADWTDLQERLASGDLEQALRAYVGPLLPHSLAPAVVEMREVLHEALAAAVRACGRPDLLASWTRQPWAADDVRAWEALAQLLPMTSPMRAVAQAHIQRLL
ncbi:GAF domain-containing protein [Yimella sp. cx-51]|nr:GAF domain-containing protein [Yimella sp. cx-51]QTH39500.1 GAF domain-containing protein [Yimella sp. cx-51]